MCKAPTLELVAMETAPVGDDALWLDEQLCLLSVLSRSRCALDVTGRDQAHWRRLENACLRTRTMQRSQSGHAEWPRRRHELLVESLRSHVGTGARRAAPRTRPLHEPSWLCRHPEAVSALSELRRMRACAAGFDPLLEAAAALPAALALPLLDTSVTSGWIAEWPDRMRKAVGRRSARVAAPMRRHATVAPQQALPLGHPLMMPASELERTPRISTRASRELERLADVEEEISRRELEFGLGGKVHREEMLDLEMIESELAMYGTERASTTR